MTTTIPTPGVPVAKVVSYTTTFTYQKRLVGAECPQSQFNYLSSFSKDYYTYDLSKREKKNYWKQISHMLENSNVYSAETLESAKDKKKRLIPVYYNHMQQYVNTWDRFNPVIDVVVGAKVD
tara:strand:- start:476 stop:841 length:366 start_codon:yes stop_codon:yes gene_type:complete